MHRGEFPYVCYMCRSLNNASQYEAFRQRYYLCIYLPTDPIVSNFNNKLLIIINQESPPTGVE